MVGGLSLTLACLNVLFRDVEHLLSALLLPWFFLTPVLYSLDNLPEGVTRHETLIDVLTYVNFVTPPLEAIRDPLFWGELPRAIDVAYLAVAAVAARSCSAPGCSGASTTRSPSICTSGQRSAGEEADAAVVVAAGDGQGRQRLAARESQELRGAARWKGPVRRDHTAHDQPRAGEAPQVRPDGVHVLVDAERALLALERRVAARAGRTRPLVQPGDDAAPLRHPGHLAHHPRQVERVVEGRDAEREVERAVGERQVLAVRLNAPESADPLGVERAAAETDHRVGQDVGADVLAASREEVLGGPAPRRSNLEQAHARAHVVLEQDPNEYSFDRHTGSSHPTCGSPASISSSSRYQPSRFAFSSQPSISRRFAAIPGSESSRSRGIPSSTS